MKHLLLAATALAFAAPASAIVVDGSLDAAYGAADSVVTYSATAPNSNFGEPTNETDHIGYSVYLAHDSTNVYGALKTNPQGGGTLISPFANLYFDLDPPPVASTGSDLGFEINTGSQIAFVPGRNGMTGFSTMVSLSTAWDAETGIFEFSIPIDYFTAAIPGLIYDNPGQTFATAQNRFIVLRLSQSFGYSVAGGESYGPTRLGTLNLFAEDAADEVPEPAMLGLFGLGAIALGLSRRRRG